MSGYKRDAVFNLKAKVGDIIYPHYNGTLGFFKRPRWDLVKEVNEEGYVNSVRHIWDYATVDAINIIKEHKELLK